MDCERKTIWRRFKRSLAKRAVRFLGDEISRIQLIRHPLVVRIQALQQEEVENSSVLNRDVIQLPAGASVLDVGANVGLFAKEVRSLFPSVNIHAVEADPRTFDLLLDNSVGDDAIRVYNRAIHSHQSELQFYSHENSLLSSLVDLDDAAEEVDCITVDACSLDQFVSEHGMTDVALLKIDTEGNDFNVLKGADRVLENEGLLYVMLEFGIDPTAKRHCHINDFIEKLVVYGFFLKRVGDWGIHDDVIYGNCLFERQT